MKPATPGATRGVVGACGRAGLILCLALPACGSDAVSDEALREGETVVLSSEHHLVTGHIRAEHLVAGRSTFSMTFEPESTLLLDVSAFMPAHGHGSMGGDIVSVSAGTFRVEGVILSMSGLWDVTVDVRVGESTDRLAFSVDVP